MKGVILAVTGLVVSVCAVFLSHTSVLAACLLGVFGVSLATIGWFVKS